MDFIDLKSQYRQLRDPINARIHAVLDHGQYILGPEICELEKCLAEYVGIKHCIAVSSGTDALLIALMAYGIGPGDEVITSPFTFISTGEVITLLGAKPVFVDIDRRTYNLDPALLSDAITDKTKAIMPVSLYGQCADFDAINSIADPCGIPVIEDGAQSFGATYKNRKSCTLSHVGATSFFPSKSLGCYGDGGALFTNDKKLNKVFRAIRMHGQNELREHICIGINGRMDSIQAAVLLAKMEIFHSEVEARIRIAQRYTDLIENDLKRRKSPIRVRTPYIEAHNTSVFAQYTIEVSDRDTVQESMKAHSIPTAVHYPLPLHLQPAFKFLGLGQGNFPVSEEVANHVISLPMHPYLTEQVQSQIIAAL
jgi:UDP-2-acetamido-2-deoxy-ribo-hexuluronate aminotransferase